MKAVVKLRRGKGYMEMMDVARPIPGDTDALIRIRASGVCGTDYHIYTGEYESCPPHIVGHEFSGEIVEVGSRVTRLKPGDRVISELNVESCGVCRYCKTGNVQICVSKRAPGTHIDGIYAEYQKMPAHLIHVLPDSVSFEEAAVIEPAAIVAHSLLERAKVEPQDLVVVLGPGPIGLLALQMARQHGARAVLMVGTDVDDRQRLPLARKLGADCVINTSQEDAVQKVLELSEGTGADLVIECSGAAAAINSGIDMLRKQGRMCVIGIPGPEKTSISWKRAVMKALNMVCTFSSSPLSWKLVLMMLECGKLDIKSLISHTYPLEQWEEAFKEIERGNVIKAVLIP
ncbi:MAG TPA: zinc-binding dehydrogenase [Nitrospirota bacterium]|nr:zinc-binding dehydrogenase [Nitrospirota bacterium]